MKILHWDEMFHPSFGYQINILSKLQAKQGHEVVIMTSDKIDKHPIFHGFANKVDILKEDILFEKKYGVKIIRLPIHRVVSGRVIYKRGYIKEIIKQAPDVIMCHTNDTLSSINILRKHKKINKPIVFDNHMLEAASTNKLSKLFKLFFRLFLTPIIKKKKFIIIKTQDSNYINKYYNIPENLTPYISFGSDTSLFYPSKEENTLYRKEFNIGLDEFVVMYAGKLTSQKGADILAKAIKTKFNTKKKVRVIIIGNFSYNDNYKENVEKEFAMSENNIDRFETQNYNELHKFYKIANLFVFPKQSSLSFFDVQACGVPVIVEELDINIERVSHNNGFTYKVDDPNDLKVKIEEVINMNDEDRKEISKNASEYVITNFNYEKIAKKYTNILIEEYNRFHTEEKR